MLTNIGIKCHNFLAFHGLTIYEIYSNSVNCTKFSQSILGKIIKIVAIRWPNSTSAGALSQLRGWRGRKGSRGERVREKRIRQCVPPTTAERDRRLFFSQSNKTQSYSYRPTTIRLTYRKPHKPNSRYNRRNWCDRERERERERENCHSKCHTLHRVFE